VKKSKERYGMTFKPKPIFYILKMLWRIMGGASFLLKHMDSVIWGFIVWMLLSHVVNISSTHSA
jgi:hypothetical protein